MIQCLITLDDHKKSAWCFAIESHINLHGTYSMYKELYTKHYVYGPCLLSLVMNDFAHILNKKVDILLDIIFTKTICKVMHRPLLLFIVKVTNKLITVTSSTEDRYQHHTPYTRCTVTYVWKTIALKRLQGILYYLHFQLDEATETRIVWRNQTRGPFHERFLPS